MTQKLYTAAEARKLDIERGGEGIAKMETSENSYYPIFLSSETTVWLEYYHPERLSNRDPRAKLWLPLTPEPAPEPEAGHKTVPQMCVSDMLDKIEQLEKELAELKEKARWRDCDNEKPDERDAIAYRSFSSGEFVGFGYRDDRAYILEAGRSEHVVLFDTSDLTWKYEADL